MDFEVFDSSGKVSLENFVFWLYFVISSLKFVNFELVLMIFNPMLVLSLCLSNYECGVI